MMTKKEAIELLKERKKFLQRTCACCWTEEMDMALFALENYPVKYCIKCSHWSMFTDTKDKNMPFLVQNKKVGLCKYHNCSMFEDDYCSKWSKSCVKV